MFGFLNLAVSALEAVAEAARINKVLTAAEVERDRIRRRNSRILWAFILLCSVGIATWLILTGP
jgi:hypothetical protein